MTHHEHAPADLNCEPDSAPVSPDTPKPESEQSPPETHQPSTAEVKRLGHAATDLVIEFDEETNSWNYDPTTFSNDL